MNLSLLSIEAAEELARLNKKLPTSLEKTKELSENLKEFFWRLDYQLIFSNAYNETYSKLPHGKIHEITNKLKNPPKKELKKLTEFCVNLSDYAQAYQEQFSPGPCFR